MKKIPWFEFSENSTDEALEREVAVFDEYVKAYGTQEVYQWAYAHGDHSHMILGGLGWDPPAFMGPLTFLEEYCRLNGFKTEDNRYLCKTCGTKNAVSDNGIRFCEKCSNKGVPTLDLGFGQTEEN